MPRPTQHATAAAPGRERTLAPRVYCDDFVRSARNREWYGVVIRTGYDDLEDDYESEEEDEKLPEGQVRVSWLNSGREELVDEGEVEVLERCFLKGDIVKKVDDLGVLGSTQAGCVARIEVTVDLVHPKDGAQQISGVDARCVRRVQTFPHSHLAFGKRRLGLVTEWTDAVTVELPNGSRAMLGVPSEMTPFRDLSLKMHGPETEPHPGQEVTMSVGAFRECLQGWLTSNHYKLSGKKVKLKIVAVEVVGVTMKVLVHDGERVEGTVHGDYLHTLCDELHNSAMVCTPLDALLQVGCKVLVAGAMEEGTQADQVPHLTRSQLAAARIDSQFSTLIVKNKHTTCDVMWQDGTVELAVPSTALRPFYYSDDMFFPGDYVQLSESEDDKVGVVWRCEDRTCLVHWLPPAMPGRDGYHPDLDLAALQAITDAAAKLDLKAEEYSVYELKVHPDWDFCLNDIVMLLADDPTPPPPSPGQPDRPSRWVGQIYAHMADGTLCIQWTDDTFSCVPPAAVYQVAEEEEYDEEGSEEASEGEWETDEEGEDDPHTHSHTDTSEGLLGEVRAMSPGRLMAVAAEVARALLDAHGGRLPQALEQHIFPQSATQPDEANGAEGQSSGQESGEEEEVWHDALEGVSGTSDNTLPPVDLHPHPPHEQHHTADSASGVSVQEEQPHTENMGGENNESTAGQQGLRRPPRPVATRQLVPCGAPTFMVLPEAPSTGHQQYAGPSVPLSAQFLSTLRKEYKLLASSLPDNILVRTFEDRTDLFSVLIFGPTDTPYEGNVFVFDLQLPPTYPAAPPTVFYHSRCTGGKLNPNLYEDGKVCLSLLGTWSGKGAEVWGPHSNLLQLLVSLQALVLTKDPYYNEAGYERQRGLHDANESSRQYNESTVLRSLQAMESWIHTPVPAFEAEINTHFSRNREHILSFCESLLDRDGRASRRAVQESLARAQALAAHTISPATASTYQATTTTISNNESDNRGDTEGQMDISFPLFPVSKGFQIVLEKTIARLKAAFEAAAARQQAESSE